MNYKLCKKLRDAGFPQNECLEVWFSDKGKNQSRTYWEILFHKNETTLKHSWHKDTEFYVIPTLSELIKECGDDFVGVYLEINSDSRHWEATACRNKRGKEIHTKGYSLEEAVAKLWLKLNK